MAAIHPKILAVNAAHIIESSRIDVSSEIAAHQSIVNKLRRAGLDVRTEVDLGELGRIDIIIEGGVGIEVKVRGVRRSIFWQCLRYLESDRVDALVLASGSPWPGSATEALRRAGKPVYLASLAKGWL